MGFPCYEIVTMTEFQKSAVKGFVETEGINHIVTLAHTHTHQPGGEIQQNNQKRGARQG